MIMLGVLGVISFGSTSFVFYGDVPSQSEMQSGNYGGHCAVFTCYRVNIDNNIRGCDISFGLPGINILMTRNTHWD